MTAPRDSACSKLIAAAAEKNGQIQAQLDVLKRLLEQQRRRKSHPAEHLSQAADAAVAGKTAELKRSVLLDAKANRNFISIEVDAENNFCCDEEAESDAEQEKNGGSSELHKSLEQLIEQTVAILQRLFESLPSEEKDGGGGVFERDEAMRLQKNFRAELNAYCEVQNFLASSIYE